MTDIPDNGIFQSANDRDDANAITLLRILDVLYAIHIKLDEKQGHKLADLHSQGGLLGPTTRLNPDKILDNGSEDEADER